MFHRWGQATYPRLGGKLEIRARFADREIDIKQFRDVEKLQADLGAARSG
jgi:hypothetical protein